MDEEEVDIFVSLSILRGTGARPACSRSPLGLSWRPYELSSIIAAARRAADERSPLRVAPAAGDVGEAVAELQAETGGGLWMGVVVP